MFTLKKKDDCRQIKHVRSMFNRTRYFYLIWMKRFHALS
jgi:hypothetical protein